MKVTAKSSRPSWTRWISAGESSVVRRTRIFGRSWVSSAMELENTSGATIGGAPTSTMPLSPDFKRLQIVAQVMNAGADRLGVRAQAVAIDRRRHAARGAFEQFDLKLVFEPAQALGQGRLGNTERLSRFANAALVKNRENIAQLANIHDIALGYDYAQER